MDVCTRSVMGVLLLGRSQRTLNERRGKSLLVSDGEFGKPQRAAW